MNSCKNIVDIIRNRLDEVLSLKCKITKKEDGSYVREGDFLIQSIVFNYIYIHLREYKLISEEMTLFSNKNWSIFLELGLVNVHDRS
ncbi:hypothetical protein HN615_01145 [Candidatus Woesearchaeota archaeon]|nr:hypothetical protein [Candidatus Woesearchaeota archaeon]